MRKKTPVDISIVITAHNEGLTAHKTLLSVQQATKKIPTDIKYEIIISIDNGDPKTIKYFDRYLDDPLYRILAVDYKDLSTSRNNAAVHAAGRYVTFLDADDLVSDGWFVKALETANKYPHHIIHPEYSITFGDDNLAWKKRNSSDLAYDTLCLIDNNLWDSPCFAERDIFINYPYHPNGNGFGYEDKSFNSQTLASGIQHLVAPKTVLFVRRKISGSMLRTASSDLVTVTKNDLFTYENILKIPISQYQNSSQLPTDGYGSKLAKELPRRTKQLALKVHNRAKKFEFYTQAVKPLREKRQRAINANISKQFPDWLLDSWKRIHIIDNQTFPSKELLKCLSWYNADNIIPGVKYTQLIHEFSKKPDTLFFVPHLIKGGADMLFINYSTELIKQHPNWHIAMLQTESKQSVWASKLPKEIDFIDLHEIFKGLDLDTQYRLLATAITQNDIKRIIIGNSQLAYDFVSHYQTLIKSLGVSIYCYAFGEEFDEEGRLWGLIHTGIPKIYPSVYRIITDNNNTVNKLEREYAFDRDKFRVHYQPTANKIYPTTVNDNRPLRILWASRVCKQKRPDILKAVSNTLNVNEFIIDVYGQLEEGLREDYFADSRVKYIGPFNGSASIPTKDYDVFLYTSEGDGVPNILQEMTAAGLPIVASNVGGIREFIDNNKTGFLIEDHEDIAAYAAAMNKLSDVSLRLRLNKSAQKLLRTRFSRTEWEDSIKRDFDR